MKARTILLTLALCFVAVAVTVTLPGLYPTGVIGEPLGVGAIPPLSDGCPPGSKTCGPPVSTPAAGSYLPAVVTPNTANLCPSCQGSSNFEQSIECCDFNAYSCGGTATTPTATVDTTMSGNTSRQDTRNGVQCLIHQPQEDTLDTTTFLSNSGPMQITARSGPLSGQLVTTSSSIATLPIFDTASLNAATGQVTVVGFLQVFIGNVSGNGNITATILNVVGCGSSAGHGPGGHSGGLRATIFAKPEKRVKANKIRVFGLAAAHTRKHRSSPVRDD